MHTSQEPEHNGPGGSAPLRFHWVIPALIAVYAVAARWVILRATHSTTEDFFITLRFAENLASGGGFVYNTGERVLGTTTPLYTLILALAAWLRLDPVLLGKSLNILAEGATVLLICSLANCLGHRKSGWLAALLYASASAPISISIGGMETALVTCAGLVSIHAYFSRRPSIFAASSAVLFLLRIDGLLLTTVLSAAWHLRQRHEGSKARLGKRPLSLFLALTLPWVIFATAYFGSPLPASMLSKISVYGRMRPGFLPNLGDFETQFAQGWAQRTLLLLFVIGCATIWRRHRDLRPALMWFAAYFGVMLFSRVPAFGWYFLPPLPLYYLVIGVGTAVIVGAMAPAVNGRSVIAGLALLALPLGWRLQGVSRDIASAQRLEDEVRRPLGQWLAEVGHPGQTIMLEPIGYIGYYSRMRALDTIGLVSPDVIPCYRREEPNPSKCIVTRFRPDWLALRPDERKSLDPSADVRPREGSGILGGEYYWVRSLPESAPAFEVYRRREER